MSNYIIFVWVFIFFLIAAIVGIISLLMNTSPEFAEAIRSLFNNSSPTMFIAAFLAVFGGLMIVSVLSVLVTSDLVKATKAPIEKQNTNLTDDNEDA